MVRLISVLSTGTSEAIWEDGGASDWKSPDTYHQYTYIMKGKPTLFLRLCKALYGTLRKVYLFWRLSETLHKWGFLTNPYDSCVANREILESQCAILWHADDLNTVVDICLLEEEFEKEAPFTMTKKCMTIWKHYWFFTAVASEGVHARLHKIFSDGSTLRMAGVAPATSENHLFAVNDENPIQVYMEKKDLSIIFLYKDIVFVKALKTRYSGYSCILNYMGNRTRKGWLQKLARVIRYRRGTMNMIRNMSASNTEIVQWWINASFVIHNDMQSQLGSWCLGVELFMHHQHDRK